MRHNSITFFYGCIDNQQQYNTTIEVESETFKRGLA